MPSICVPFLQTHTILVQLVCNISADTDSLEIVTPIIDPGIMTIAVAAQSTILSWTGTTKKCPWAVLNGCTPRKGDEADVGLALSLGQD